MMDGWITADRMKWLANIIPEDGRSLSQVFEEIVYLQNPWLLDHDHQIVISICDQTPLGDKDYPVAKIDVTYRPHIPMDFITVKIEPAGGQP